MKKTTRIVYSAPLALGIFALLKFAVLYQFIVLVFQSEPALPFAHFRSDILLVSMAVLGALLYKKLPKTSPLIALLSYIALALMVADLITLMTIGHRFLAYEALAFDSLNGVDDFIYIFPSFLVLFGFSAASGLYLVNFFKPVSMLLLVGIGFTALVGHEMQLPGSLSSSADNVVFQNLDWRFMLPSSGDAQRYKKSFKEATATQERPDIIVLFAESFSAADSKRISSITPGRLPKFDAHSQKGTLFENMIAEGCSTDRAYVTLIGGVAPFAYSADPSRYRPYVGDSTIVDVMKQAGYHTVFEKTYTLDFLNLRAYLKAAGFNEYYGQNEHFGNTDYVFGAQPDAVLYDDIISRLKSKRSKPLFLMATTISTHMPYNTPYGKDLESAYHYADDALSEFITNLETQGYFKNGVLIVFGDHRKMNQMPNQEKERYGISAYGRVAAMMMGKGVKKHRDKGIYMLSDIHYSLKNLVGEGAVRIDYNDIFQSTQNRPFALHNFGINPSKYMKVTARGGFDFEVNDAKGHDDAYAYLQDIRAYYQERAQTR